MLIDQIIQFKLTWPKPPGCTCTPKLVIFMINQEFLMEDVLLK